MTIHDFSARTIHGDEISLSDFEGKTLLIVNVASKCGLTPQYEGLQALYEKFSDRGFEVLGFPCNQFGEQEPGTESQIQEFCSLTYNVTFPMFAKVDVKRDTQHPLFARLSEVPDPDGEAGKVKWNFEKWVVAPDGDPVARFRTLVEPNDEQLVDTIEKHLPA